MEISARSMLTAGTGLLAATAVVMAPSVAPPVHVSATPAVHATASSMRLAADVTPFTQQLLQSALDLIDGIAPNLDLPAAPAAPAVAAPLNTASNIIDSVYSISRYWANYVSTGLAPWVLQFVPFGWVVTDQINIWYYPFVVRTTDAFVYKFLDPIVNDPLNLGVWINSTVALISETIQGAINGFIGEINYLFGWILPPLPPLPGSASLEAAALTLSTGEADAAAVPMSARLALTPSPDAVTDPGAETVAAVAGAVEEVAGAAPAEAAAPAEPVVPPVDETVPAPAATVPEEAGSATVSGDEMVTGEDGDDAAEAAEADAEAAAEAAAAEAEDADGAEAAAEAAAAEAAAAEAEAEDSDDGNTDSGNTNDGASDAGGGSDNAPSGAGDNGGGNSGDTGGADD